MSNAQRQRRHRQQRKAQKASDISMAEAQALKVAPPLPATTDDLLPLRKLKAKRNINDFVEDILVRLWNDEDFTQYLDAIYDSQAVEGSKDADDMIAAIKIREHAKKNNLHEVANAKLDTIIRAMKVALRRYDQDRRERYDQATLAPSRPDEATPSDPV